MTYKILKSDPKRDSLVDFENEVNKFLQNGWTPLGGIVILSVEIGNQNRLGSQFFQTIIIDQNF